ncbi:MAG: cobalamin-dependent protein [Proteobacteria bacterium]|nr:cobalamin-dependent protein [Pseudomonadota bacterium]
MISEPLYKKYFQGLISGDRKGCHDIVQDLLDQKIGVYDLYINLFQKALYDVGRLWESNKISVAIEHLATSITEGLLNLSYPIIFSSERVNYSAVVTCVEEELHQIGAKMVADIFEMNGWDSIFLGSNTPSLELLKLIEEKKPDLLCLSMSIYFHLQKLLETLALVHHSFPELQIIVGGQGFRWGGIEEVSKLSNVHFIGSLPALETFINQA